MGVLETIDEGVRGLGNCLLQAYGNWRAERYDVGETIVVACTGRGGSTWLAQIIASLPRHHLLWEQLHWRTNPECQDYGFGEPLYLTEHRASFRHEQYVRKILSGRTLPSAINTSQYFRPWKLIWLRAYVAKLVTANMMLPWMVQTFGVRAVFMVRHPCAVVSSQLRHGAWDEVEKQFCNHPELFEEYPHLGTVYEGIRSKEEILAFNWAVQNFVPLVHSEPRPWITTTYEVLIDEGMTEVERIFKELGEKVPRNAKAKLRSPSETASANLSSSSEESQLKKWKRHLSESQIDRILRIVQAVGIRGYSERIYPDGALSAVVD